MGRGLFFLPVFLIGYLLFLLESVNEIMIAQIVSSHVLSLSLLYTIWVPNSELESPLHGTKCEK